MPLNNPIPRIKPKRRGGTPLPPRLRGILPKGENNNKNLRSKGKREQRKENKEKKGERLFIKKQSKREE